MFGFSGLGGRVWLLPWGLQRTPAEGPGCVPAAARVVGRSAVCLPTQPPGFLADPPQGVQEESEVSRHSPLHPLCVLPVPSAGGQGRARPLPVQAPVNQTPRATHSERTTKRACPASTSHTRLRTRIHTDDKPPLRRREQASSREETSVAGTTEWDACLPHHRKRAKTTADHLSGAGLAEMTPPGRPNGGEPRAWLDGGLASGAHPEGAGHVQQGCGWTSWGGQASPVAVTWSVKCASRLLTEQSPARGKTCLDKRRETQQRMN